MKATREEVLAYFYEVLRSMRDDWDDSEVISEDSCFMTNLNWRSIEIVYLAQETQQHFGQTFPFEEFLKEMESRENKDITVREWVDFIYGNLGIEGAARQEGDSGDQVEAPRVES